MKYQIIIIINFHILNDKNYVIKKDHITKFYNITGISYQNYRLIQELIKRSHDKEWLLHDDKMYSLLANKIRIEMNQKCKQ